MVPGCPKGRGEARRRWEQSSGRLRMGQGLPAGAASGNNSQLGLGNSAVQHSERAL